MSAILPLKEVKRRLDCPWETNDYINFKNKVANLNMLKMNIISDLAVLYAGV